MDARDAGIVKVGTPLRDAAVDPKPGDFLPPTNAGEADPHGPLVAAPGIHAVPPAPIVPGAVNDGGHKGQEARETEAAEAVLVEGKDVGDVFAPETETSHPAGNAGKAEWVEFAVAQGMARDEAESLNRNELRGRFGDA